MTTKPTEPGAPSGDARPTTHAPPPLEEGITLATSPSFDQHASDATDRQNLADTLTVGLPYESRVAPPRPTGPEGADDDDEGGVPISGGWFVTNPPPESRTAGAPDADASPDGVGAPTAARTDPAMLLLGGIAVAVVVILGGYALFATASP